MAKICIIGAGSVTFGPNITRDLALTKSLYNNKISLMDIDKERLEMSYSLMKRYFQETGAEYEVEKTLDRRECIRDASVILNVASAISNEEILAMIETAEKYGYYRGIDAQEWNMVSNYLTFTGYKNLKIALDVARDVEELSPSAWLIQIANPVFEISTLILRETKVKVIGYCHGAPGGMKLLASKALNVDTKDVEYQVAGFNHVVFLTRFKYREENGYNLIDEWIEKKAEEFWKNYVIPPWQETLSKAAVDMYKHIGLYPLGDTARSGTWKYHYNLETKKKWYGPIGGIDSEIGWGIRLLLYQTGYETFKKAAFDTSTNVTKIYPPERSSEHLIDILDSLINGTERRLILNVKNDGIIPNIPNDVVVEVPVYISSKGIRYEQVEPLPKRLYSMVLYPRLERMELALDAFINGSREPIVEALIRDPRTKSEQQAREVVDAVFRLPFNKELDIHYK